MAHLDRVHLGFRFVQISKRFSLQDLRARIFFGIR